MFSIPNDLQQALTDAAAASQAQQIARDHVLSKILDQLVRLNIALDMILDDEAPIPVSDEAPE